MSHWTIYKKNSNNDKIRQQTIANITHITTKHYIYIITNKNKLRPHSLANLIAHTTTKFDKYTISNNNKLIQKQKCN